MVFKFEKNTIDLQFENGFKSEIEPIKTGKIISTYTRTFQDIVDGKLTDETDESVCEKVVNAIDEIIGEGSCKKIFGDETINLWHLVDVWTYICGEYREFNRRKMQKIQGNRKQRRHNKK